MAGIKEEKKIYLVGIYCRLSKDDGTDNESASIATQKSILADYVKKQGWHLAKTYVDDGYSGTNFQRPSFQNMIKDIESGLINCVITKDDCVIIEPTQKDLENQGFVAGSICF